MENKTHLKEYADFLEYEKGSSKNTINGYGYDLRTFFDYIENKSVESVEEQDILEYIDSVKSKYSNYTLARKISALRGFFRFMFSEGVIKKIPTENLEKVSVAKILPETLKTNEIKMIYDAIGTNLSEKKDKMILELLIATGARVSEVLKMQVKDISEDYSYIRVFGKGSKFRIIPLYKDVANSLKYYVEHVRIRDDSNKHFVFGKRSRQTFWRNLKKYSSRAGIKKNVYPHIFRHSVATLMLENGAEIRVIQEILGHSDISTTEIYTHVSKKKLKNIYERSGIGDI